MCLLVLPMASALGVLRAYRHDRAGAGCVCVLLVLHWLVRAGSKAIALKMVTDGVASPSVVLLTIGICVMRGDSLVEDL